MPAVVGSVVANVDLNVAPAERKFQQFAKSIESRNYKIGLDGRAFSQPLGVISGQLGEFDKSLKASNARVLAFGASAGIFIGVQKTITGLVRATIEVEKSLKDINVVLGTTQAKLNEFGASLFKIAKDTGQSFATISVAATEFSRQGLNATEILTRTRDAMILTRLSGLEVADSVDAITAALNTFNKAGLDSTALVNKLAAVDAQFAVSSGDLAEAIKRVGSTAVDAGVDINQLIALITAAKQITGRDGSVIGNAFKTIFTRINSQGTLNQLASAGIAVTDLRGEALPTIKVLENLANGFDKVSTAQQTQLAKTVGGLYQINILRANLSDLSKENSIYANAVRTSAEATGVAIQRNEELNQTLAALANRTSVALKQAGSSIGKSTVNPVLGRVLGLTNDALELGQDAGNTFGIGLLKGIGNFLTGPGLALGGAVLGKLFIDFIKDVSAASKSVLKLNDIVSQQATIQSRVTKELARQPNLLQQNVSAAQQLLGVEQSILGTVQAQNVIRQSTQAAFLKNNPQFAPQYSQNQSSQFVRGLVSPLQYAERSVPRLGARFRSFDDLQQDAASRARTPTGQFAGNYVLVNDSQYVLKSKAAGFEKAGGANLNGIRQAAALQLALQRQAVDPERIRKIVEKANRLASPRSELLSQKEIAQRAKELNPQSGVSTLRKSALPLAIFGPIAAGVAQQYIGQDNTARRGGSALAQLGGDALSYGALGGAYAGPIGAGVGAGLGILSNLPQVIRGFSDTIPDLKKKLEELQDSTNRSSNAISEYINVSEQLQDTTGKSSREIRALQSRRDATFLSFSKEDQLLLRRAKDPGIYDQAVSGQKSEIQRLIEAGNVITQRNQGATLGNAARIAFKEFVENPGKYADNSITKEASESVLGPLLSAKGKTGKDLIDYAIENQSATRYLRKQGSTPEDFGRILKSIAEELQSDEIAGLAGDILANADKSNTRSIVSDIIKRLSPENINTIKADREEDKKRLGNSAEVATSLDDFRVSLEKSVFSLNEWANDLQRLAEMADLAARGEEEIRQTIAAGKLNLKQPFLNTRDFEIAKGVEFITQLEEGGRIANNAAKEAIAPAFARSISEQAGDFKSAARDNFGNDKFKSGSDVRAALERVDFILSNLEGYGNLLKNGTISPDQLRSLLTRKINEEQNTLIKLRDNIPGAAPEGVTATEIAKGIGIYQKGLDSLNKGIGNEDETRDKTRREIADGKARTTEQVDLAVQLKKNLEGIIFAGGIDTGFASKTESALNSSIKKSLGKKLGDNSLLGQGLFEEADFISTLGSKAQLSESQLRELISVQSKQLEKNANLSGVGLASGSFSSLGTQQVLERYKENIGADLRNKFGKEGGLDSEFRAIFELRALTEEELVDKEQELINEKINQIKTQQGISSSLKRIDDEVRKIAFKSGLISGRENANLISDKADRAIQDGEVPDFGEVFSSRFEYNSRDLYQDLKDGAIDVADTMKNGFADAFKEFARGAKSAEDILRDFGINIAYKLLDKSIDVGVNSLIGGALNLGQSYFGNKNAAGGLIKGYSGGGKVSGGSGNKDDVPAMLSAGEYVVRKSAVNKYGENFLKNLNSGGILRYAQGGVNLNLANGFTYNDVKRPTGGVASIDPRLSNFALSDEDNVASGRRRNREDSLIQYLSDLAAYEEQKRLALKAYKDGKSARLISAYIGLASNVGGAYLGSLGKAGAGGSTVIGGSTSSPITSGLSYGNATSGLGNGISYGNNYYSPSVGMSYKAMGGVMKKYAGGGRSTDDIPALLMGGEYVIKKDVVSRHGVDFFNKINNGTIEKFANGGVVGGVTSVGGGSDTMDRLITVSESIRDLLDSKQKNNPQDKERKESGGITNHVSISVTVQSNGEVKTETTKKGSESKKEKESDSQKLGELIKSAVITTILQEKRQGGLLSNLN